MIPIIALVGRQNVGKSTLFNRLTHTRDALVANFPGLTRDRKYGHVEWKGYKLIVIDTGGIDGVEEVVTDLIVSQSMLAIKEANLVLFMVDGYTGLMAADKDLARYLRSHKKLTIILVNKIDLINANSAMGDFYSLGIENIIPIAASCGRGINYLLEQIYKLLVNNGILVINKYDLVPLLDDKSSSYNKKKMFFHSKSFPIKVAIVGRPNVGKSTLINCLLREERMVVYEKFGTTRDSIYTTLVHKKQEYILIDTAGVRKQGNVTGIIEKFSIAKTLQAIEDANVVVLVIDAYEGISNQDLVLLSFIINSGRSIVIAVNKWDSISSKIRNEVKKTLDYRLKFIDFVRIHFISALYGSAVGDLFRSVYEAYECATKRISTALLTRIMHMAVNEHQPPLVYGRRIKPKYAHAGGYNPPLVVIHGTQVKNLSDTYKRYLMKYFRRMLKIMGTPIQIQFNEGLNPFNRKRNNVIPIQVYKKKL